jgi:cobalt-zinc-cadmium efflux system outer membrane protein
MYSADPFVIRNPQKIWAFSALIFLSWEFLCPASAQMEIPGLRPSIQSTGSVQSSGFSSPSTLGTSGLQLSPLPAQQMPSLPSPSQFIPFSVPTAHVASEKSPPISNGELLTLSQSLDTSLSTSPRLSGIRALLGVARANFAQATVLPNPGIYIANNYGNSYLTGASIPVEPPWKLFFRLAVAKRQMAQAKTDILRQLWLFRGEVRKNYAQLIMAEEIVKTRDKLMQLASRIVEASKIQYDAGNAPGLDVRRAKLAFIQAKMDSEQANIQLHQAREQMNLILGRSPDAPIVVPPLADTKQSGDNELLPDFKVEFPNRDKMIQTALKSRLEIKIAGQAIETNEANLKNAIGNIVPTPRFVVGKVTETNPPAGPLTNRGFFQAYIDAPIFNVQQGDIARFKALRLQLKLDQQSQENQIAGQVSLAYYRLQAARQRLKTFQDEALPESEAVANISSHGYQIGQLDLNTLLDSQRANIQIQSQYFDAVLAYQLAFNDLEQSIGVPLK